MGRATTSKEWKSIPRPHWLSQSILLVARTFDFQMTAWTHLCQLCFLGIADSRQLCGLPAQSKCFSPLCSVLEEAFWLWLLTKSCLVYKLVLSMVCSPGLKPGREKFHARCYQKLLLPPLIWMWKWLEQKSLFLLLPESYASGVKTWL